MMLCWIDSDGVSNHDVAELAGLRTRTDGFLWLDIPEEREAETILTNEFHFISMAIAESKIRSHVPRVHVYPDHVFIVVHAPEGWRRRLRAHLEPTSSSGKTSWSRCMARLAPRCRWTRRCGRR